MSARDNFISGIPFFFGPKREKNSCCVPTQENWNEVDRGKKLLEAESWEKLKKKIFSSTSLFERWRATDKRF